MLITSIVLGWNELLKVLNWYARYWCVWISWSAKGVVKRMKTHGVRVRVKVWVLTGKWNWGILERESVTENSRNEGRRGE